MALQFQGAPDWLLQEYINRKNPIQQAAEGAQNILGAYSTIQQQQQAAQLAQQQKDIEMAKGLAANGQDFMDAYNSIVNARTVAAKPVGGLFGRKPQPAMPVTPSNIPPADYTPENPIAPANYQPDTGEAPQTVTPSGSPIIQHSLMLASGGPTTPTEKPLTNSPLTDPLVNEYQKDPIAFKKQHGEAGVAKLKQQAELDKILKEKGPTKYLTRKQLSEQGNVLNPGEALFPSENRDWNLTTDPTTGRRILVDKVTGEVKEVPGLGSGPMSEFTPNQLKVIDETASTYGKDDIVAGSRTNLSQINQLRKLLNSGNPAAPGPFRSNAARVIAGEKGVLTDRDVARNTGSESYAAQFKRYVQKAYDGNFTEQDKKDFNSLLDLVEGAAKNRLNKTTSAYVKRASLRSGVNDENRIRQMIELQSNFDEPATSTGTASGGWTYGGRKS